MECKTDVRLVIKILIDTALSYSNDKVVFRYRDP